MGAATLARNVRNKLFLAFSVLTTLISLWAAAFLLGRIWPGTFDGLSAGTDLGLRPLTSGVAAPGEGFYYRIHLFFQLWLAPAGVAFIRLLTRVPGKGSRRLQDASVLYAMILSVALLFHWDSEPGLRFSILFSPGWLLAQLLQLMWIDRRLRLGLRRLPKLPTVGLARRNLIYLGGLFVLLTTVMDHVPEFPIWIPALGNFALTAYLFFVSQAISQQRLLNIGALFSRSLVLLSVALTLTLLYSLFVAWVEDSPGLFFLNSFLVSFLLMTLLDPLRQVVGFLTRRLLTQKHRRLEQTIREAQQRLAGTVDLDTVFESILLIIEQTLQPERASLFVLRSDGTKYLRLRSVGLAPDAGDLREIRIDHPLLQYCEGLRRRGEVPIVLDQILESELDRLASRVQRENLAGLLQGLKALRANLLLPLMVPPVSAGGLPQSGPEVLGFVCAYVPSPPEPWGNNWGLLPVIYPFFEQAAQALKSTEIFVRSREKERLAALGEMAAGLAHEIRNPLGAIKGAAQFLDPSADRPESKFLKIIVEETDRLNKVVTQFLDYSRPSHAEFRHFDLSLLAERTVESLRPGLRSGIALEFYPLSLEGRAGIVNGSPDQIQQVLHNLIQNSVRALEGNPEGRIRVSIVDDGRVPGAEFTLQVEDNGKGIKKEHLDKLFIPFFTTTDSGTGLGLSICQKIVENHRGRIEVLSEDNDSRPTKSGIPLGRLTRFSVILPGVAAELIADVSTKVSSGAKLVGKNANRNQLK